MYETPLVGVIDTVLVVHARNINKRVLLRILTDILIGSTQIVCIIA